MGDVIQAANEQAASLMPRPAQSEISGVWPFAGLASSIGPKPDLSKLVENWIPAHQMLVDHNLQVEQRVAEQQLKTARNFEEMRQALINNLVAKQATIDALQSGLAVILDRNRLTQAIQLNQDSRDVAASILAESQQVIQNGEELSRFRDNFGAYVAGRFKHISRDPRLAEVMGVARNQAQWFQQGPSGEEPLGAANTMTLPVIPDMTYDDINRVFLSATKEILGTSYHAAIEKLARGDSTWANDLSSDELSVFQSGWKAAIGAASSIMVTPDIMKDPTVRESMSALHLDAYGTPGTAMQKLASRLQELTTPDAGSTAAAPATALWAAWLSRVGGPLLTAVTPGDVQRRLANATHLAAIKAIQAGENVLEVETLAKHRLGELVMPVVANAVVAGDIEPFIPYLKSLGLGDLEMDDLFRTGADSLYGLLEKAVSEQRIQNGDSSLRAWQQAQLALFPAVSRDLMENVISPVRRMQAVRNEARDYLSAIREAPPEEQMRFTRALSGADPEYLQGLQEALGEGVLEEIQQTYRVGSSLGAADLQTMVPADISGVPGQRAGVPSTDVGVSPNPMVHIQQTLDGLKTRALEAKPPTPSGQPAPVLTPDSSRADGMGAEISFGPSPSRLITPESLMAEQRMRKAQYENLMPKMPSSTPVPQQPQAPQQASLTPVGRPTPLTPPGSTPLQSGFRWPQSQGAQNA